MLSTFTLHRLSARTLFVLCTLTMGLFLTTTQALAQERYYLVEVVVFENLVEAKKGASGQLYFPRNNSAIGLTSDKAESLGFALLDGSLTLENEVNKIRSSGNYRLLKHFAWRQPGLDDQSAEAIRINIGSTLNIYIPDDVSRFDKFIPASARPTPSSTRQLTTTTVSGTLKVRLGRFLHLDTQLVFTDTENLKSYRLSQSRKMRSKEFHYIDNPRFGLLVKILPLEESAN